jgi:hypothetical protein
VARPIQAAASVNAPAERIFEYLSRLENHWRLAERGIEVLDLETDPAAPPETPADRGRVRIRGPLGLSRTARTRVVGAEPPRRMSGTAEIGRRTRARVSWTLTPSGPTTKIRLTAELERAAALDRLLLAAGGRAWMNRLFRSVLQTLADMFSAPDRRDRAVEAGVDSRTEVSRR